MSFMRLGTRIAVINEAGEILLSKRGDFGTWALPGGRVDSGELLHESAVREVREETGLEVEIERAVGLYYQQGRSRTNVLYRAKPVGGEMFRKSDETLDNRFFARDALPDNLFGKFYIDHAYTTQTYLHTVETSRWELIKLDLQLRWRWLQNLLSGRPEPKFPQFDIWVVGIITNESRKRALKLFGDDLPRTRIDGSQSPHHQLSAYWHMEFDWKWIGIWQDTASDTIEFVFTTVDYFVTDLWITQKDLKLTRDKIYMQKIQSKRSRKVWFLEGAI